MTRCLPLLLALTIACGGKHLVDWAATPNLPSPTAGSYGIATDQPTDPAIRAVLGERGWDAYLAGAAAGLALAISGGEGGFTEREVREAAWRAGWPYPIDGAHSWALGEGEAPPEDLLTTVHAIPTSAAVGLVRARGREGDTWVALYATPRVDLGVLPRAVPLGETLLLPVVPGASWLVCGPDGRVREGSLDAEPATIRLATEGEWLVRVRDAQGQLAAFAVYAGMDPPLANLLPNEETVPADPQAAIDRATVVFARVREAFGTRAPRRDPFLDGAARATLQSGTLDRPGVLARLGAATPVATWHCTGRSVEACLDDVVTDPRQRAMLVSTDLAFLGLGASLSDRGVELLGVLAGE